MEHSLHVHVCAASDSLGVITSNQAHIQEHHMLQFSVTLKPVIIALS